LKFRYLLPVVTSLSSFKETWVNEFRFGFWVIIFIDLNRRIGPWAVFVVDGLDEMDDSVVAGFGTEHLENFV